MDSDGDRDRNSQHDQDPFASLHDSIDKSINSLFATIISLPTAIYQQGSDHGREWARSMQRRQPYLENEDASADVEHCPYLPHPRDRVQPAEMTLTGDDKTDVVGNDWISSILRQMNLEKTKARDVCPYFQQDEAQAMGEAMAARSEERGDGRERNPELSQSMGEMWKQMDRLQSSLSQGMNSLQKEMFGSIDGQADGAQERSSWPFPSILSDELPLAKPLSNLFAIGLSPAFLHFRPEATVAGYLLFSNYSPLVLESQHGFDIQWRSRFEDLLRVQSGQEMMAVSERAEASSGAGISWFAQRIAPVLKQREGSETYQIDNDDDDELTACDIERFLAVRQVADAAEEIQQAEDDLETEEAAYDSIQRQQPSDFSSSSIASHIPPGTFTSSRSAESMDNTTTTTSSPPNPSTILSSLTRTETYRSPDGTMTTQKVLRETFANGREQVTETTEKVRGEDREVNTRTYSTKSAKLSTVDRGKATASEEVPTKRGWFWNS